MGNQLLLRERSPIVIGTPNLFLELDLTVGRIKLPFCHIVPTSEGKGYIHAVLVGESVIVTEFVGTYSRQDVNIFSLDQYVHLLVCIAQSDD